MLDRIKPVLQVCYSGQEGSVKEHHPILRVIGDIDHLVGMQTRIEGMADEACTRTAKVNLEVPPVIPCDGAAPSFLRQIQLGQYRTQAPRIPGHLLPVRDVDFARSFNRDDFGAPMASGCVIDKGRDQQLLVHHFAKHRAAP